MPNLVFFGSRFIRGHFCPFPAQNALVEYLCKIGFNVITKTIAVQEEQLFYNFGKCSLSPHCQFMTQLVRKVDLDKMID